MCHCAVNWCDKLHFCCFIAGFDYRTRLVSEQAHGHTHTHTHTHHGSFMVRYIRFQSVSFIYMATVT